MLGLVLAGGASRRFGAVKALARLGDKTFLERVYEALSEAVSEVCISVPRDAGPVAAHARGLTDCIVLDEELPCGGPPAGIVSSGAEELVYVMVDVPWVEPSTLTSLTRLHRAAGASATTLLWGDLRPAHMLGVLGPRAVKVLEASCRVKGGRARLLDAYRVEGSLFAGWSIVAGDPGELANYNRPVPELGNVDPVDRLVAAYDWFYPRSLELVEYGDVLGAKVLLLRESDYWSGLGLREVSRVCFLDERRLAPDGSYI